MKKLHGVKKLNKALRKIFFEATGIDMPMKLDSDFYYLPEKQKVRYSILLSKQADLNFCKFLETVFRFHVHSDIDLFCISVLHEFGHYKTYNNIAEGDFKYSKKEQEKLELALKKDPLNNELYSRYFFLPIEIMATMWAIEFIDKHQCEYITLKEGVEKLLHEFYAKNITPVT